ncbi:MAG TPA: transcriptional regulator [Clostridiales bacterium]|nr:transcriptional regulator [Clostridiales bacterium]
MNTIGQFIKIERKKAGLTQEDFAMRSGLGLRFVRDLEQGKKTVRLDKVNQALAMFGREAVPGLPGCVLVPGTKTQLTHHE